jgi:hypothetical protein
MLRKRIAAEPASPTKCYEHCHMTMSEYALYDIARAWSATTGILFFDGRKLSQQYQKCSKSNTYKLADSLTAKGFFVVNSEPSRRPNGTWSPRTYKVLNHDAWAKTHPGQCQGLGEAPADLGVPGHLPDPLTELTVTATELSQLGDTAAEPTGLLTELTVAAAEPSGLLTEPAYPLRSTKRIH